MNATAKRAICAILLACFMLPFFASCEEAAPEEAHGAPYSTYVDIPGVTQAEIEQIEALKEQYDSFSYGMLYSTESFYDDEGNIDGFALLVCEWLTELFGIPFIPENHVWTALIEGLADETIDFTGYLMDNAARREIMLMTDPIAQRSIKYFRLVGSPPLEEIREERLPRYALVEGAATTQSVLDYAGNDFEPVYVEVYTDAYELMQNGTVDALVTVGVNETGFGNDVYTENYLPLIFASASFSTQNTELGPFVSVFQKAMENGGASYLGELYRKGDQSYRSHKLLSSLGEVERAYIAANPVVPIAVEYDNYPVSFYNIHEEEWQGITMDVIGELEALSGLRFEVVNADDTQWTTLLNMLETGEAHMISELIRIPEREGRFLWPERSFFTDNFALISMADFPYITVNEIMTMRVGLIDGYAHTELFWRLFPDHRYTTVFSNTYEALEALSAGEIDMVANNTSLLLYLTHYQELPRYKANYVFDEGFESLFGFNKEQEALVSIVNGALNHIDTEAISNRWISKTYDYRLMVAQAQIPWMVGVSILLALMLVVLVVLHIRSRRFNKTITSQMVELKAAEAAAARAGARIRAIIANLPGMVFQCENTFPDYPLTFVSNGSKELLGYTAEELVGQVNQYMKMIHPDDFEAYSINAMETLEKGLPFENTHRLIMADGSEKWVFESCVVTGNNADGSPCMLDGYVCDVTWQRQYESVELKNRAKSEFLATMSHEIRTPMNSIMGFAELALDSATMTQMKEYLSKITDSTSWLLRIINDILDISKIEAGKMELESVPFGLDEVFTRCQSVILPPIKEKGLDLRIYVEPAQGRLLLGDPVRLYQVLMNLLTNAVKFTDKGVIKFSALAKVHEGERATIYFEVQDSGIGMSAEQIEKIFDPFIQADSSTTRNYGGTGLGLAISKNIVDLMGGNLVVDSVPGEGSRFGFELAFDTVDAAEADPASGEVVFTEKPCFDALVLVCDDNPMNQEVIGEHLSRVGIRAVAADNGRAGVEAVRERMREGVEQFDLIFMDMFMPIMDGLEAAEEIEKLGAGLPMVAMTANVMTSELEKYKKHGMPDCLGKPFTSQELWRILLKYLTPLGMNPLYDENEPSCEESLRKLCINFLKNNSAAPTRGDAHVEIDEALKTGDLKLAHRLAHSLKTSAGMIGKTGLRDAAEEVETLLKDRIDSILDSKMERLKTEMETVLIELSPLLADTAPTEHKLLSPAEATSLLDRLEGMLKNLNPECESLLDELSGVPGSEQLAQSIEEYNFAAALEALLELRGKVVSSG